MFIMTNDRIKKAAEKYADNLVKTRPELDLEWCATRDDFMAGAHYRDDEVKSLKFVIKCVLDYLSHSLKYINKVYD